MGNTTCSLLIDIGNSTTGLAVYDGKGITQVDYLKTESLINAFPKEKIESYKRVYISSVVPELDHQLSRFSNTTLITVQNIPFLKTDVPLPNQIGADRLVNALAAFQHTKKETLIIDSGTALTFCFVNEKGIYEGGAIFPGMGIASKALHLYTAKIPHIFVSQQDHFIGKTTKDAVQCGLYYGYQHIINGFIDRYKKQYPNVVVVGTGNGLDVIKDELMLDIYDSSLIFKGLALCADVL